MSNYGSLDTKNSQILLALTIFIGIVDTFGYKLAIIGNSNYLVPAFCSLNFTIYHIDIVSGPIYKLAAKLR